MARDVNRSGDHSEIYSRGDSAHCLYEMTFHGFTEEKIQGFAKKLEESVDEEGKEFIELSDLLDDK